MNPLSITVLAHNRPAHLRHSLFALRNCVGIDECQVRVFIDPSECTQKLLAACDQLGFEASVFPEHVGQNRASYTCLRHGFDTLKSPYHLHIEEDVVLCEDALLYANWARQFEHDPEVFSVGMLRFSAGGNLSGAIKYRWFSVSGWATWRDRWESTIRPNWPAPPHCFGPTMLTLRGKRCEILPEVSRAQNIGALGLNLSDPMYHAKYHHAPVVADDYAKEPVSEYVLSPGIVEFEACSSRQALRS